MELFVACQSYVFVSKKTRTFTFTAKVIKFIAWSNFAGLAEFALFCRITFWFPVELFGEYLTNFLHRHKA